MKKNSNFVLREIYGKNILMPIRYNEISNEPIYFNEIAAVIWKLADECRDVNELETVICREYCLEEDSAEAMAIGSFVGQLIESKLVDLI